MNRIPLIIPAYEPDDRMNQLILSLRKIYHGDIIIVNDGSGENYDCFYEYAASCKCTILKHYRNMGKGRALKTAFNYCLITYSDLIGCVIADSDGQHQPEDILKCMKELEAYSNYLILGSRDFDNPTVPIKSRLGNKFTRKICKFLCGLNISDTQTGLRSIPKDFMVELLNIEGERFEFETRMLIESEGKFPIREISIETIYDSRENHQTHFDPIKDSIRIYRIFGRMLGRFLFSSLSSSIIDLGLFFVFCKCLRKMGNSYLFAATIIARLLSASYNYLINYSFVFGSNEKHRKALKKYIILALIQMMSSACLVSIGCTLLQFIPEIIIKIFVDIFLFLFSYIIQKKIVFK